MHDFILKTSGMQSLLGLKDKFGARLRETYYNARMLIRIKDKVAPLKLKIDEPAPIRISLFASEIGFGAFYDGYIGRSNLLIRQTILV